MYERERQRKEGDFLHKQLTVGDHTVITAIDDLSAYGTNMQNKTTNIMWMSLPTEKILLDLSFNYSPLQIEQRANQVEQ